MKSISRRAVLRGAGGIAVTLPFLEIMHRPPAHAGAGGAPKRLIMLTTPNGTIADRWFPDTSQVGMATKDITLSPILEPLEPYKDEVNILLGVDNKVTRGGHNHGMVSLHTGRRPLRAGDDRLTSDGVSVDQHIASRLAADPKTRTPFSSLVLSTRSKTDPHELFGTAYAAPKVFVPRMKGAKDMFETIFGVREAKAAELRRMRRSILDEAAVDLGHLQRRLGAGDKARLDLHLTSIREVERRLALTDQLALPEFTPGTSTNHRHQLHMMIPEMFAVMELALVADMSRVVNFMIRTEGATAAYTFGWLGIGPKPDPYAEHNQDGPTGTSHHAMSHQERHAHNRDNLTKIGHYFVSEWAALIGRLKAREDVDGTTLFDNTLMVHSSPIARGGHSGNDMPFLLMGRAGGAIRQGRYLNLRTDGSTDFSHPNHKGKPTAETIHTWGNTVNNRYTAADYRGISHNDLLLTLVHAMGFKDEETFGDPALCAGPIDQLLT